MTSLIQTPGAYKMCVKKKSNPRFSLFSIQVEVKYEGGKVNIFKHKKIPPWFVSGESALSESGGVRREFPTLWCTPMLGILIGLRTRLKGQRKYSWQLYGSNVPSLHYPWWATTYWWVSVVQCTGIMRFPTYYVHIIRCLPGAKQKKNPN